jgi:HEAT repeat protein
MWNFRAAFLCALLAVNAPAAEPVLRDHDKNEHDKKLLQQANLPTDAPGLLHFFNNRTFNDASRQRATELIKQLGNDDFDVREKAMKDIVSLGSVAESFLRRATDNTDPEVSRRASECLDRLKMARVGPDLITAAARVLASQSAAAHTPATVEAFLNYLPSAADEPIEEEIAGLLTVIGIVNGKPHPALTTAAQDKLAVRRLASAGALARAGGEHREAVRKLLADPDHRVRFVAAQSLIAVHDKSGVQALIGLLGDGPLSMSWTLEDQLCRIAGDKSPTALLDPGNAASRLKCQAAWETWWKANAETLDLARLPARPKFLGIKLVCVLDGGPNAGFGQVFEIGADGKERWKIDSVDGPMDVQMLPTGRLLIAEHNGQRVTERTREGRIVWEHKVAGEPVSCQRLANGNTFIATYTELTEVTREGKEVYTVQRPSGIFGAQKLPGGTILYIHRSGNIVEVKTDGQEIRSLYVGNIRGWGSVELLPNGRFLVALYNANAVKEIDANGKEYFKCSVTMPTFATRLSNGHTLTADSQNRKVVEFDELGKKVAEHSVGGRPFCVRGR